MFVKSVSFRKIVFAYILGSGPCMAAKFGFEKTVVIPVLLFL